MLNNVEWNKFYDFKTDVHLVGFYSILSLMMHGAMNVKSDNGCPQGGVMSPLSWCLVVNDRLEDLQKEGFLVYGYTDDIGTSVREKILNLLKPAGYVLHQEL
jgi:hypothetical protein